MRAKVSLQRVRGLALLPAEPSADNPQILFQPMTDNGALSCTVAKGQGDFLQPCRSFSIIPLLEKMSEMWLKIVRLFHKLLPLLHKSHLFRAWHTKEREEKAEHHHHRRSQSTAMFWRLQSCIKWEYMFTPQMKPFSLYDFLMDQSVVCLTMAKTRNHLRASE